MSQHHSSRRHVVVVGRSLEKMRQALQVLDSAGFAATGALNRDAAMAVITARHRLFAVVAGGSVDRDAEAELRAAAEAIGGQVVRANIGDSDPTQHFIDHVLPPTREAAIHGHVNCASALPRPSHECGRSQCRRRALEGESLGGKRRTGSRGHARNSLPSIAALSMPTVSN
jgi:hypothetical protein